MKRSIGTWRAVVAAGLSVVMALGGVPALAVEEEPAGGEAAVVEENALVGNAAGVEDVATVDDGDLAGTDAGIAGVDTSDDESADTDIVTIANGEDMGEAVDAAGVAKDESADADVVAVDEEAPVKAEAVEVLDNAASESDGRDAASEGLTAQSEGLEAQASRTSIARAKVAKVAKKAYTGKVIKPKPRVTYGGRTLKLGRDYTLSYKSNKKAGTATIIVKGKGSFYGTKRVTFRIVAPAVSYGVHVQGIGDQSARKNGVIAGTSGESRRLEAIRIKLGKGFPVSGGIQYRTHIQGIGWQGWRKNGALSGTTRQSRRLEAIQIKLTGTMAKKYDVWYRVHAQNFGWMGWAKNGQKSGTAGYSYRLEAIQVVLKPKGFKAPAAAYKSARRATKAKFKKYVNPLASAYAANPTSLNLGKREYKEFTGTIEIRHSPGYYDAVTSRPGNDQYVLVVPSAVRYATYSDPTNVLGLARDGSPSSPYFAPYLGKVVTVGARWGYGAQGSVANLIGMDATVVREF